MLSFSFCRYDVKFANIVLRVLGDELAVKLRHIGMRDGNIVVNIETSNGPMAGAKKLFKVQQKFLSQVPSMFSPAKVPKNPEFVWTCTIICLLLMLFRTRKVLTPTSLLFMGSQSSTRRS